MSVTILRKCGGCSDPVVIKRDNLSDIIYYKTKYYHSECFCKIAEKRSKTKISTAPEWKDALDNRFGLEADTRNMLENSLFQDELNEWLLNHYNITAVPKRFWSIAADLNNGKYKGKKCKPVDMKTIFDAWQWGQRKLDSISRNNKMNHKGPTSDDERVMYDFSIIISKVPNYLSHKAKVEAQQAEEQRTSKKTHINYDNVQKNQSTNNDGLDDISNILDDIF